MVFHNKVKMEFWDMIGSIAIIFLLLSSLYSVQAQTAASLGFVEGVNFDKKVVFKTGANMDIYYPEPAKLQEKNPWMLFIHGGGWAGGDKDNIFKTAFVGTFKALVDSGVVCVSVGYRLAKSPVTSYESMLDCKDAARYLIKNAEQYKLDTAEYGTWGGSAGGHLCLLTALVADSSFVDDPLLADISTDFKCVASFYPFTSCLNPDLRPGSIFEDETLFIRLLGDTLKNKLELAALLSPAEHLKQNSPPIYLLHGDKDPTLPIINSTYMMEVADSVNADVKLLTVNNAKHSFGGNNISPSFAGIADSCARFVLSHLNVTKYATLDSINIGGVNYEGFDSEVFSYDVELDFGTNDVPAVIGFPNQSDASVSEKPATGLPGSTTIFVQNSDGGISTYTINFTVATSVEKVNTSNLKVFPNPGNDRLNIYADVLIGRVTLFNTTGSAIVELNGLGVTNTSINTNGFSKGLYILSVETAQGNSSQKIHIK